MLNCCLEKKVDALHNPPAAEVHLPGQEPGGPTHAPGQQGRFHTDAAGAEATVGSGNVDGVSATQLPGSQKAQMPPSQQQTRVLEMSFPANTSTNEQKRLANELKTEGNALFQKAKYSAAIEVCGVPTPHPGGGTDTTPCGYRPTPWGYRPTP